MNLPVTSNNSTLWWCHCIGGWGGAIPCQPSGLTLDINAMMPRRPMMKTPGADYRWGSEQDHKWCWIKQMQKRGYQDARVGGLQAEMMGGNKRSLTVQACPQFHTTTRLLTQRGGWQLGHHCWNAIRHNLYKSPVPQHMVWSKQRGMGKMEGCARSKRRRSRHEQCWTSEKHIHFSSTHCIKCSHRNISRLTNVISGTLCHALPLSTSNYLVKWWPKQNHPQQKEWVVFKHTSLCIHLFEGVKAIPLSPQLTPR